jgi:hypothetical protein
MERVINFIKSTAGKYMPAVLLLVFSLWGCEKKPKTTLHTDVLEAEINGTKYTFKDLGHAGSIGQYFTIQGEHNVNNEVYTYISISACNLIEWPIKSVFPLVTQFCSFFNTNGYTQIYISDRKTSTRTVYITQDSIPDQNSIISFEKFEVIDGNNFEIKGTFKMALAGEVGSNPPSAPDSCFATGRFHLKRPRRTTVD